MAQHSLRCLQRVAVWWGGVLPASREGSALPGHPSLKVVARGAPAFSCRMLHTPSDRYPPQRPPSHYDVLKVSPNSTQDEIKKAYYKMSLENHPDLHGGSVEASDKFRSISEAYEVLGDPSKRSNYDAVYGVYRGATAEQVSQPESIFRRRRRTGKMHYNVDAWEDAHYGGTQPPDWRRAHSPHAWWRHHGPRASPYDAMRFWDEEMARRRGGTKAAEQQRKVMQERMEELRKMHRFAFLIFMVFFFLFFIMNIAVDGRRVVHRNQFDHPYDRK